MPNSKPLRAGPAAADVLADFEAVLLADAGRAGLSGAGGVGGARSRRTRACCGEGSRTSGGRGAGVGTLAAASLLLPTTDSTAFADEDALEADLRLQLDALIVVPIGGDATLRADSLISGQSELPITRSSIIII